MTNHYVIARVEHHPMGHVLILDEKFGTGESRPSYWLRKPATEPKGGDVLTMTGKDGVILSCDRETHVRQYAPRGLEEFTPVETHGHS
jgi:hypothetical protein